MEAKLDLTETKAVDELAVLAILVLVAVNLDIWWRRRNP